MIELNSALTFILAIEILGIIALPISLVLFHQLPDKGWGFSKVIGITLVAWIVWLASSLRLLPFNKQNLFIIVALFALVNWLVIFRLFSRKFITFERSHLIKTAQFIFFQELLLLTTFFGWSWLRGYMPDINGLEKFMDYGFMLSILKTDYFPPIDHYLARETINYYYFGHYIAGMLTRLAQVPPAIGYNLQMSAIMALAVAESFAIGAWYFYSATKDRIRLIPWRSLLSGGLAALFVVAFGNLHAVIYMLEDYSNYWYPDATRFIENTIHEFPIYSFIVNDLHAHVNNIPVVLMIIALLSVYFLQSPFSPGEKLTVFSKRFFTYITHNFTIFLMLTFSIGISYANNSWDFAIYLVLSGSTLWAINTLQQPEHIPFFDKLLSFKVMLRTGIQSILVLGLAILFFLPFWSTVQPISQGPGIVPKDGHSPLWQLAVLWGIQVPITLGFIFWLLRDNIKKLFKPETFLKTLSQLFGIDIEIRNKQNNQESPNGANNAQLVSIFGLHLNRIDVFVCITIIVGFFLIILPEFIYVKDIYPTHYRANTMFKLFYQAWILLGLACGYSVVRLWQHFNTKPSIYGYFYRIITLFLIIAGALYPARAVEQGFSGFNEHKNTINGVTYLKSKLPGDAEAIKWINDNLSGQPTILEAVGDSYTDYARVASNTGNPTVLGWPVHEWLWRGSYDQPFIPTSQLQEETGEADSVATRTEDVRQFYENNDNTLHNKTITKYAVEYVYVGVLEREKYPAFDPAALEKLELEVVYDKNETRIYKTEFAK